MDTSLTQVDWIEHAPSILWIAGVIIAVLWTIISTLAVIVHRNVGKEVCELKTRVSALEDKVQNADKDINSVKLNYTARFDGIHQEVGKLQDGMHREMGAMQVAILEQLHRLELLIVDKNAKPTQTKRR